MASQTAVAAPPDPVSPRSPQVAAAATRPLGLALIALSVVTVPALLVLVAVFNFPENLRADAATNLPLLADHLTTIKAAYWVLAMTGFLLAGIAVALRRLLKARSPGAADLVGAFGVMTGVFWAIGYIRWSIAIPYLADRYPGAKVDTAALYELANRYGGMAVGEHLGFIGMGLFAAALAVAWRRANLGGRWVTPVGYAAGAFIATTGYEQLDPSQKLLGDLNGLANTIWFLWLVAIGVLLLRRREA